ncbi:MAG TPA: hypothetical protein VF498_21130 [Anaerolineales bacterium]
MTNVFFIPVMVILIAVLSLPGSITVSRLNRARPETAQQAAGSPTPPPAGDLSTRLQIQSPRPGQALQGRVPVLGSVAAENLQSLEVSFAYVDVPNPAWFLVPPAGLPSGDGPLAQWDTTTITDGDYNLRLVATWKDGSQKSLVISGLRVRNYTPVETDTPVPASTQKNAPLPSATPAPSRTPLLATSTPLAANPALLTNQQIALSLGKGLLAVAGIFALMGAYSLMRSLRNK